VPPSRSFASDFPRLALAFTAVLTLTAAAPSGAREELVFLAVLAGTALVAAAALAPAPAHELIAGAALIPLAAWTLPAGPGRAAAIAALAAATVAVALGRRLRDTRPLDLGEWILTAIAVQTLARGDVLVESGFGARAAVVLLAWPVIAAAAVWMLDGALGSWALVLAAAAIAAQGGFHAANVAVLVALSLAARLAPVDLRRRRAPAFARALAALAMLPVLVAAYPWRHPRPLAAALQLPAEAARAVLSRPLLDGSGLPLDAAKPLWSADLDGRRADGVVVVSNLAHGAGLASGTPAIEVEATTTAGEAFRWTLRVGFETGEWAARRPDVAALRPATPSAWQSMLADGFFAQRYRSEHRFASPQPLQRIAVRRAATLPAETQVALFWLELR
jgi:hypothetical protein